MFSMCIICLVDRVMTTEPAVMFRSVYCVICVNEARSIVSCVRLKCGMVYVTVYGVVSGSIVYTACAAD